MVRRPERYLPVMDFGLAVTSATVPEARSWPPSSPAPGPRSRRRSAERMTSGSCSTTRMVLPRSLMEADGGLVEDVEGADEPRAEGCGELDALRFAAGEGGAEAVEGEVFEADLDEEVDALADLFEDFAGDFYL
jgi:hypothetical protein